jgi:hypothetical protein
MLREAKESDPELEDMAFVPEWVVRRLNADLVGYPSTRKVALAALVRESCEQRDTARKLTNQLP